MQQKGGENEGGIEEREKGGSLGGKKRGEKEGVGGRWVGRETDREKRL